MRVDVLDFHLDAHILQLCECVYVQAAGVAADRRDHINQLERQLEQVHQHPCFDGDDDCL